MAISRAKAATKALSNHSSSLNVSALGSVSQPGPLSVMHGDCAASTMAEAKMSTIIAPSKYGETTTYAARPGTGPKASARSPAGVRRRRPWRGGVDRRGAGAPSAVRILEVGGKRPHETPKSGSSISSSSSPCLAGGGGTRGGRRAGG